MIYSICVIIFFFAYLLFSASKEFGKIMQWIFSPVLCYFGLHDEYPPCKCKTRKHRPDELEYRLVKVDTTGKEYSAIFERLHIPVDKKVLFVGDVLQKNWTIRKIHKDCVDLKYTGTNPFFRSHYCPQLPLQPR